VAGLLVLFVFAQAGYFVVNALAITLLHRRTVNHVPEEPPSSYPTVNVLMPVYRERRAILEETLDDLRNVTYPSDRIEVFVVHEPDDAVVKEYIDDLEADRRLDGLGFTAVEVDRESMEWGDATYVLSGTRLPRTKAVALNYAFFRLTLPPDSVVTVFDSDTKVPTDLFELGVRGLEAYDFVQAKQTVRNVEDGWLPMLESMGMAAWSHTIYPKTTLGPFQLLGKGYFVDVDTLYSLDGWDDGSITEDMALGIAASGADYSLGVIDRYVQDLCPASFDQWLKQKSRWVTGPYRTLLSPDLSVVDRLHFASFTLSNQAISLLNVVGIPSGVLVLLLVVSGNGPNYWWALEALLLFNLVNWAYYTLRTYEATAQAVRLDGWRQKLRYHVVSNPIMQIVYAALWAIPVAWALLRWLRAEELTFDVTPK
jgi:cellulose synthase/poly-beta-1,6-N-acetylglucosamine synthase-like glycosyltransferase